MVPDFLMFFKVFSCSVLAESKPGSLIDSRGQKLWFWYNRRSGFRFSRRLRPCTFFYHVIRVTFGHFWAKQRPYLDSTQNLGGNPTIGFLTFLWFFIFDPKMTQNTWFWPLQHVAAPHHGVRGSIVISIKYSTEPHLWIFRKLPEKKFHPKF